MFTHTLISLVFISRLYGLVLWLVLLYLFVSLPIYVSVCVVSFVLVNCLLNAFSICVPESYCVVVVVKCMAFWLVCLCY